MPVIQNPSRRDGVPVAHIFKYGENVAPKTRMFVPNGTIEKHVFGCVNGCSEFHPVPFGTGILIGLGI